MTSKNKPNPHAPLPLHGSFRLMAILSLMIALLMTSLSIMGLINPEEIYPTAALQESFLANDVVNLFIGLPILLGSLWFAWRGKLLGLLLWPGALIYTLYNYLVYLFSTAPGWLFLLYLALVALCAYLLIGLVASIDGQAVKHRLAGLVPEKISAGILIVLGLFVLLRTVAVIANAQFRQSDIPPTEASLLIADFLLSPTWIIGGLLLWRHKALGYVSGAGLLFQASMLFIGLIVFMLLQPLLTGASFALIDVIVVFLMGMITFIPLGLFLRGIQSKRS